MGAAWNQVLEIGTKRDSLEQAVQRLSFGQLSLVP
jgi:hypothetical protein